VAAFDAWLASLDVVPTLRLKAAVGDKAAYVHVHALRELFALSEHKVGELDSETGGEVTKLRRDVPLVDHDRVALQLRQPIAIRSRPLVRIQLGA